jgi:hypothetical protein
VPFGVVTVTGPVLRPVPATTTSCVAVDEVTDLTGTPPIVMLVKPVKFVPLIVTVVPELPLVGVKLVIVGAFTGATKVNPDTSVPVPAEVVATTVTGPAAWAGVVAVQLIVVVHETLVAAVPPKVKVVPPTTKSLPAMVTGVPPAVGPLFGETMTTVGGIAGAL